MPRFDIGANEVKTQAFFVLLESPAEFDVREVYDAVRTGLQDILQDANIQTSVKYKVGELPTFVEPDGSTSFDPAFAFSKTPDELSDSGE